MPKRRRVSKPDSVYDLPPGYYEYPDYGPPALARRVPVVTNTTEEEPVARFLNNRPMPNAVIDQENRGLTELVKAEQLPKSLVADEKSAAALKELGFKIHGPTDGDDLFYDADLPPGWTKKRDPNDHRTMNFFDEKGRQRGYVWYKAASYDRAANGALLRRFSVERRFFKDYTQLQVFILDRLDRDGPNKQRVVFQTKLTKAPTSWQDKDELEKKLLAEARDWAKERGIDVNSYTAHWDDPELPTVGVYPPY